jgi:hypothetical protein
MNKILRPVILLTFLLLGGWGAAQSEQRFCLDFNNIPEKTVFGKAANQKPGDVIIKDRSVVVSLKEFSPRANEKDFLNVEVLTPAAFNGRFKAGNGKFLMPSNVNLHFDLTQLPGKKAKRICLDFFEGGGEENIAVNGESLLILKNWKEINGKEIAKGVKATITLDKDTTFQQGSLCLEGDITSLTIGGQETAFDNVCITYLDNYSCRITDNFVVPDHCDAQENMYLRVTFINADTKAESYKLIVENQEFGPFKYNGPNPTVSPIIGPIKRFSGEYKMIIRDEQHPACQTILPFSYGCGNTCDLRGLKTSMLICRRDSVQSHLLVDVDQIDPVNIKVKVTANGLDLGDYFANDFPLRIKLPASFNSLNVAPKVVVTMNYNGNKCSLEDNAKINEDMACKLDSEPCPLSDLTATPFGCRSDNAFSLNISFKGKVNSAAGYLIYVNGRRFGPFAYSAPFPGIGPITATPNGNYQIILSDLRTPTCGDTLNWKGFNCTACPDFYSNPEFVYCTDTKKNFLRIDFRSSGLLQKKVILSFEGQKLGTYLATNAPLIIENLKVEPNSSFLSILRICLADNPLCCAEIETKTRFETCIANEKCRLDAKIEPIRCDPAGTYYLAVEAAAKNASDKGYFVLGPDKNQYGPFPYDRPVQAGPFKQLLIAGPLPFVIFDAEDKACADTIILNNIKCKETCSLDELSVKDLKCNDNGTYAMTFNMKVLGLDSLFQLETSSGFVFRFRAKQLPIRIDNIPAPKSNDNFDYLAVCAIGNSNCCNKLRYEFPCKPQPCTLGELKLEQVCLANGSSMVSLDFERKNVSGSFTVSLNGRAAGTFTYLQLPLRLPVTLGTDPIVVEVKVEDSNKLCSQTGKLELKKCTTSCPILGLKVEFSACVQGSFSATAKVTPGTVPSNSLGFILYADGELYGPYKYDNAELKIGPFPGGPARKMDFLVIDIANPTCFREASFTSPACATPVCKVSNLEVKPLGCNNDGSRKLSVNFKVENPSARTFVLFVNGQRYGSFPIQRLPLETSLRLPDQASYKVGVCVGEQNNCCETLEVRLPCVLPCPDLIVELKQGECKLSGNFDAELRLRTPSTSPIYRISINGKIVDTIPANVRIYSLGSFKGDGSQWKIELINTKDTTCRRSFVVGPVKCRTPRTDNVWPGDANNDNTANHYDLLHIGVAFGAKGAPRLGNNLTAWRAQPALDWDEVFFDARNYKFADASGDGVVDQNDIAVLQQNYGLSHGAFTQPKALPFTDLDPKITYKFPASKQLPDSTTFEIPVVLGSANRIVKDIYGLAFSVFFDPAYIDAKSIEVVVPTTWLGQPKVNLSSIYKVYPKEGRIDIALSRTDQNEVSGYGELLFIKGIVVDLVGKAVTNIKTDYATINRMDGEQLPVNTADDGEIELIDVPRSYAPERLRNRITIFPNPSYGLVTLSSAFGTINQIQVLNTDGMPIGAPILNKNQIEVDNLAAGVYFLKVQVAGQTYYEKLVKQTP